MNAADAADAANNGDPAAPSVCFPVVRPRASQRSPNLSATTFAGKASSDTRNNNAGSSTADAVASSLVEMNNQNSVLHKIANLYAEKLMSDICLVVGPNRYPAHRVILCASSDVFQVMLMNPQWSECRETIIELKEEPLCTDVFSHFLKYLYCGQIAISLETVMPVLALADKYNVKDLVQLCVEYMLKHISKAVTQGYLVAWLHYTVSFSPYHQAVTDALQQFLKWNLDIVAQASDFVELDANIMVALLQQNDLVLANEFELFGYVQTWLLHRIGQLSEDSVPGTDDEKLLANCQLIESLVVHVRFGMMLPNDLAQLLLQPIIKHHAAFFVDRISIGMSYHSGNLAHVKEIQRSLAGGALQFTPRLYTADMYSLAMSVTNFDAVQDFQTFGACFFSHTDLSEFKEEQTMQWNIDFCPRGIHYSKAQLINVLNMHSPPLEIPESILKTVRLSVTCKRDLEHEVRYLIAVLITGVQNQVPHVRTVHHRTHYFSRDDRTLNLDNLLPYDELEQSSISLSSHLIGAERNRIDLQVVIIPMSEHVCSETPPFEFT